VDEGKNWERETWCTDRSGRQYDHPPLLARKCEVMITETTMIWLAGDMWEGKYILQG
jgi:hypothetical protein